MFTSSADLELPAPDSAAGMQPASGATASVSSAGNAAVALIGLNVGGSHG